MRSPCLIAEVKHAPPELVQELAKRFRSLLQDRQFIDAVSGHMPTDAMSQARVLSLLDVIAKLSESK